MSENKCCTCGEEFGYFERMAIELYGYGCWNYSNECDECEEASAMKAAVAKGEDELKASEGYRKLRSERIRSIDDYDRRLDP